ncbi:hypothetical protein Tco_0797163 [Tanacetum coccineum]
MVRTPRIGFKDFVSLTFLASLLYLGLLLASLIRHDKLQTPIAGCFPWLGASLTQGLVSSIPIASSIIPEGFLPPNLLLVMIIVMVVIVAVILVVVVVTIVGVVIVVMIIEVVVVVVVGSGVPSIIKLSFVIIGSFSGYWSFACPAVPISIVSIFHGSSLCFQRCGNTISNQLFDGSLSHGWCCRC